ncbi:hypothetical protein [Alloactinosynnema sp. L-07]|nr:hypothetical protein [Alloactinosynnema sp. L-07]
MSVDQLAARLRAVLAQLDQARQTIANAGDLLGDAAHALAAAVRGSGDADLAQSVLHLSRAREDVDGLAGALSQSAQIVTSYLVDIGASPGKPRRSTQRLELGHPPNRSAGRRTGTTIATPTPRCRTRMTCRRESGAGSGTPR